MIINGASVFGPDKKFAVRDIATAQDRFSEISTDDQVLDGTGLLAIPGLVDIHFHGCKGYTFCDATEESLHAISAYEASRGVCAICPASWTQPQEVLLAALENAAVWAKKNHVSDTDCASLIGVNMEGPFLSTSKIGGQNKDLIQAPDIHLFERFQDHAAGLIKLVSLACEQPHAMEFISTLHDQVSISLAHSDATYNTAAEAFDRGARQCTHLWNAMSALHHREPGIIGAAFDHPGVSVELICDGVHIHPSVVRLTFEAFRDRVIMISDTTIAAGLSDGSYEFDGKIVTVRGRRVSLDNGTLVGSCTDLMGCLRIAVTEMSIPPETAISSATINPARAIGVENDYGSIETGKVANVVLVDKDFQVKFVVLRGMLLS